jgi:hypothetical protein
MAERTPYQKKLIERYYDRREQIVLDRLSQLVSELYLADTERKRERLWKRVAAALERLKVGEALAAHILAKRSPEVLAANLRDWLR